MNQSDSQQGPGRAMTQAPSKRVHPGAVVLAACILAGVVGSARAESRGELLYSTHCIACHTAQVHWREKKLATDWNSLKLQVRRWQAVAALGWSEEDVVDVTRHLNERFYGFKPGSNSLGVLMPAVGDGRDRFGSK
ncbi:MAG: cytochrome C [Variovorax sp.]|nr:MAG: cytochrome C [Variovorax sp.]